MTEIEIGRNNFLELIRKGHERVTKMEEECKKMNDKLQTSLDEYRKKVLLSREETIPEHDAGNESDF